MSTHDGRRLATNVLVLRKRHNLSIKNLSELTGLSPQALRNIERGDQGRPFHSTLQKLADIFGVHVTDLLGTLPDATPKPVVGAEVRAPVITAPALPSPPPTFAEVVQKHTSEPPAPSRPRLVVAEVAPPKPAWTVPGSAVRLEEPSPRDDALARAEEVIKDLLVYGTGDGDAVKRARIFLKTVRPR